MSTSALPPQEGIITERTQVSQPKEMPLQSRRWLILATVVIGTFMAILDVFIVNVAIPSISKGLGASLGEIELVIASYTLAYAVLVITGGRLGDLYGYKYLFMTGIAVFTLASALCGLAPTALVLIAARVLEGISAALMYPQVLSIIQVTFTGRERNVALGVFGATVGLASIAGQLLGGILIQANLWGLTWRPIFLVNIPMGVLALVAASILLVNQQAPSRRVRLDVAGVGIVTMALLLLVIPLISGRGAGWPLWMLLSLVASLPAFVAFAWFEQRLAARGGSPLVNLALFKQRAFTVGVLIALAFFAGNAGFLFVLTLFLQFGLGFSPLHAGLTFIPFSAAFFVSSLLAPRLIPVLGRGVLSLGYFTTTLGMSALLTIIQLAGPAVSSWVLIPALLIQGFGSGLGLTPLVGTIISRVQSRDAGAAAGVVSTSFQVGNVLGIAVVGLVFFLLLGLQSAGSAHAVQYIAAISGTLPFIAALAFIAYGLVFLLPRSEANVFLEHLPHRAAAVAYALYFLTGGHVSDRFIDELRNRTIQRKTARGEGAPHDLATYLVYNYTEAGEDREWINFITRGALTVGEGQVVHEEERRQVIEGFVDEIRQRQAEGHIEAALNPASVRLMVFALNTCPRVFPQITRMITGHTPTDPAFEAEWTHFLGQLGQRLAGTNEGENASHL